MITNIQAYRRRVQALLRGVLALTICMVATTAHAQIFREFIAPHEYALGTDFKPFNIFVQYNTLQDGDQSWDNHGDKYKTDNTQSFVGLSKFVHLWTPSFSNKIGVAWEIIVPEVGIRDRTTRTNASGIGDPITGFALWFKPATNWTFGGDLFVQVPLGDKDVGGGDNYNVVGSLFWDGQYGNFNYDGDLGYKVPGQPNVAAKPGILFHTNHRFGYQFGPLLEPYLGFDYGMQQENKANPGNRQLDLTAGVMFHFFKHSSVAVHYSRGVQGDSINLDNNFNLRFVYVW